jgi:aspartyl-tRNA synthetase
MFSTFNDCRGSSVFLLQALLHIPFQWHEIKASSFHSGVKNIEIMLQIIKIVINIPSNIFKRVIFKMHQYRTHTCGQLTKSDSGKKVKLSGWVHRKRDHGGVYFIDLRDHYGITQLVSSDQSDRANRLSPEVFAKLTSLSYETVISITGTVFERSADSVNSTISTGEIEVIVEELDVLSEAEMLPMNVNSEIQYPEDVRLRYRFLDLRRDKLHKNITLRNDVIKYIRDKMHELGFMEFNTPILTASSPEGARDFLVPSRLHPGKFYALPQAPQQFKQLLMVSGFDRYFQIAPCFRDEDARADRAPGEFYQLDVEMSFVTQEDVFAVAESVMHGVFTSFSSNPVTSFPFPRIKYSDAMVKYGSDKPDLRNPIEICDVTELFRDSGFAIFRDAIANGSVVRAIQGPKTFYQPRSFFDKMVSYAQNELNAGGLGYITIGEDGSAKGPIVKFLNEGRMKELIDLTSISAGDSVFFVCQPPREASVISGKIRTKLGEDLDIIEKGEFKFCWITDFPLYEWNAEEKKVDFSHNPFSMPQGGMEALLSADTVDKKLDITGYQYDLVCNGIELCSGAIRNHKPEIMYKAFEIAGYPKEEVDERFGCMINAFKYGAPPHGGLAPGIDRIVMLLADEANIREVICFPLNQSAQNLMMNAPSTVSERQLRELNISLSPKAKEKLKN